MYLQKERQNELNERGPLYLNVKVYNRDKMQKGKYVDPLCFKLKSNSIFPPKKNMEFLQTIIPLFWTFSIFSVFYSIGLFMHYQTAYSF